MTCMLYYSLGWYVVGSMVAKTSTDQKNKTRTTTVSVLAPVLAGERLPCVEVCPCPDPQGVLLDLVHLIVPDVPSSGESVLVQILVREGGQGMCAVSFEWSSQEENNVVACRGVAREKRQNMWYRSSQNARNEDSGSFNSMLTRLRSRVSN